MNTTQTTNKTVKLICPICNWVFENNRYYSTPYKLDKIDENKPRSICFCQNCGVGIAYPTLTDQQTEKLYKDGAYWRKSKKRILKPNRNPGHYASAQARWKFVKPHVLKKKGQDPISILDIGAGYGYFGMVAARDNCLRSYHAVEADLVFQESLKSTWEKYFPKINFEVTGLIENVEGKFDLVVFSHILEHLENPNVMLKAVREKLTDEGCLFIEVPNQDYRFKRDVFPHLLFFNTESLTELIERNEFKIDEIACYGRDINESPINDQYRSRFKILEQAFYKSKVFLPSFVSARFFAWYFGTDQQNNEGTWIRALVSKKIDI